MDEMLSQEEIDSLLAQAADGGEAAGIEGALAEMAEERPGEAGVRRFDFNRPFNISRNFDKNLRNICEAFAKNSSLHFTNQIRASAMLEFRSLQLLAYADWYAKLPNPTCVASATLAPLKGSSLLHLDLPLCFAVIKKLLGGPIEPESHNREFTEIELSLIRSIVQRLLDLFKDASARVVALDPKLQGIENNPVYLSAMAPGDNVVVLEYMMQLESLEGRLVFCIPLSGFEPVRAQFDPEESLELRSPGEVRRDRRAVLDVLQGTSAEAVVKLGELTLSLERIMRLEEGDLIPLGQPVAAPLVVEVEGKPAYAGVAGRVRQNRAVQLTRRLNEE